MAKNNLQTILIECVHQNVWDSQIFPFFAIFSSKFIFILTNIKAKKFQNQFIVNFKNLFNKKKTIFILYISSFKIDIKSETIVPRMVRQELMMERIIPTI